jgi:hypothetical protein
MLDNEPVDLSSQPQLESKRVMGVHVQWDDDAKTTILMKIVGRWEWQDIQDAVLICNEMIESVPYHVHFILDRQGGLWTPGNLLTNVRKIINTFTPNDGYRVIVGENPLVREMFHAFEMLNGGAGFRYRYVSSMAEARDFLSRQPPRLKPPKSL